MVQRGWKAHVLGKAEHTFTECVQPKCASNALTLTSTRICAPLQPGDGGDRAAQGVCVLRAPVAHAHRHAQ